MFDELFAFDEGDRVHYFNPANYRDPFNGRNGSIVCITPRGDAAVRWEWDEYEGHLVIPVGIKCLTLLG